ISIGKCTWYSRGARKACEVIPQKEEFRVFASSIAVQPFSPRPRLPLVQRWTGKAGLRPLRERRLRSLKPLPPTLRWKAGRVYAYFGTNEQGLPFAPFDFSQGMSELCADIALHCDTLRHINTRNILFTVTQARKHRQHGLQARITPLRFFRGAL